MAGSGRRSRTEPPQLRNRVRELRGGRGLTQAELAERAGVTRQTIIAIERGGYVPSVALALTLARALAAPVERLFWFQEAKEEAV